MVAMKRLQLTQVPARVDGPPSESSGAVAVSSLPDPAIRDYFLPLTIYATAPTAINPQ